MTKEITSLDTFIEAIDNDIENLLTKKTIIQDFNSYIQEATWQLGDTSFYKKLTITPH